jgi:hypothetical protein
MTDFGDILMEFDAKNKKEKEFEELKQGVKTLKRRRDAMLERETKIREDLNSGVVGNSSNYRLPLAVLPAPNHSKSQEPPSDLDIARLRRVAQMKRKLQAHAICNGVTSFKDKDETKFIFDPYIGGKPFGPYVLRMMFSRQKAVLRGHTLPHSVPTRSLYAEYFEDEDDHGKQLPPFIQAIARHLRAFLSRKQQCDQLRNRFSEDIVEFHAVNHCTAVSFTLCLKDESSREQINISLSMLYDREEERPKFGSLKLEFEPKNVDEEDQREVEKQIGAFYKMNLVEAVLEAF